jgi:hypothetical protein
LGDDSGLEVDALGGAPGPRSARYGGPGLDDAARTAALLEALVAVPDDERSARFVCVAALATPQGDVATARGVCEGRLLRAPRGSGGFGYDPIFAIGEATMAELPAAAKDALSHRGRAFRALIPALRARSADRRPRRQSPRATVPAAPMDTLTSVLAGVLKRLCRVPSDLEAVTDRANETPPRAVRLSRAAIERIWQSVETLYRTGLHPAIQLCVRHRGEIVLDRAIGYAAGNAPDDEPGAAKRRATTDTPFRIYSTSKAITAMVVHLLDDRGVLHIDDRVCDSLPGVQ